MMHLKRYTHQEITCHSRLRGQLGPHRLHRLDSNTILGHNTPQICALKRHAVFILHQTQGWRRKGGKVVLASQQKDSTQ